MARVSTDEATAVLKTFIDKYDWLIILVIDKLPSMYIYVDSRHSPPICLPATSSLDRLTSNKYEADMTGFNTKDKNSD